MNVKEYDGSREKVYAGRYLAGISEIYKWGISRYDDGRVIPNAMSMKSEMTLTTTMITPLWRLSCCCSHSRHSCRLPASASSHTCTHSRGPCRSSASAASRAGSHSRPTVSRTRCHSRFLRASARSCPRSRKKFRSSD